VVEFVDALTEGNAFGWSEDTTKRYACSMRAIANAMVEIAKDRDFEINSLYMDEFDVATVCDLVARRSETVKIATVNRDLTALRHFMTFCKNRQWIDANPVDAYEKQGMKELLPPVVLPTDEALRKMINRGPTTFGFLVRFIDKEGTRATETARLTWPDIEFDRDNPTIATATLRHAKGGEPRVITLDPETVAMLRAMPRSNRWPYVFFNDGEEGWYRDLSTRFWQYGQDVQFGARLHDLRHGFAIRKLKSGWSIYRVSAHLGHRSVITTERYYFRYLTEEQKTRALSSGDNGFA
jgi:integrase/recombinase XerD